MMFCIGSIRWSERRSKSGVLLGTTLCVPFPAVLAGERVDGSVLYVVCALLVFGAFLAEEVTHVCYMT